MQQEQTVAPSASFAGLLAALTAARSQPAGDSACALDAVEEDVVTLSYERALQTHARYKPERAPGEKPVPRPAAAQAQPEERKAGRKQASITVRMTQVECAQLQQRASEAGMTVSAYLRSCTLEVESLRAQVKQTLAELRAAQTPAPRRTRLPWLRLVRKAAS